MDKGNWRESRVSRRLKGARKAEQRACMVRIARLVLGLTLVGLDSTGLSGLSDWVCKSVLCIFCLAGRCLDGHV